MANIKMLNPKAELANARDALAINISAARGLQEVLKSNLGPKGTIKMLVSGAGDIKTTKDGNSLLHDMQITHPTATLIARVATAQDDHTGDGTTSTVLLIGEALKQADIYISDGLHPRIIADGFYKAKDIAMNVLNSMKLPSINDEQLNDIALTALKTKLNEKLAEKMSCAVVDAVKKIDGKNGIDLHMIEMMEMMHRSDIDSRLVNGLVLDHGARHPNMPKHLTNCYILTCNVSLEFEKTEVNSSFFYKTAEERTQMVKCERHIIDKRIEKIISIQDQLKLNDKDARLVVINQKGIDPISLDQLARANILGIRRAKRRNMERIPLACGGEALNDLTDLTIDHLGKAGKVYEHVLAENKYTFIEDCKNCQSVTLLIKGPNKYTITRIKEALRDGLRAVKNAIDDKCVIPGAGAFEIAAYQRIMKEKESVKDRSRFALQAYADALLIIPKTLAANAGLDSQEIMSNLLFEQKKLNEDDKPKCIGINLNDGQSMNPVEFGIFDNYCVKKQMIDSMAMICSRLLLVDEMIRAGLSSLSG
ncbi:hypothetical protein SNEBB_005271 [Seison nebaliae]|nr:hypothetical protein SNEBB_005271 [Seison nebaliae]